MDKKNIKDIVRSWVEDFVVAEQLCPFARQPLASGKIRFAVSAAESEAALIAALAEELQRLLQTAEIETTLLIHPCVLNDFPTYNQFLDDVDELLRRLDLEGVVQVASFHPDYQFAGTNADDAENYSNRSPYPLLHLLREESIEVAVEAHPDIDAVPERNIQHLSQIGADELQRRQEHWCKNSGTAAGDRATAAGDSATAAGDSGEPIL
jgi:hypothetical protein